MGKIQCPYRLDGVTVHSGILQPSQNVEPSAPMKEAASKKPFSTGRGPISTCSMMARLRWMWRIIICGPAALTSLAGKSREPS